jgi:archaellum component FlaF (FlaF/FlaG flagellin family)
MKRNEHANKELCTRLVLFTRLYKDAVQQNIKFCNAKQAKQTHQYNNIKTKLYKNNAAIWYNKSAE